MSTGVAVKPSKKHKQHKTQEERLEEERLERYNKLVHMATRAIHKEVKMVKSFECQKIVRKLKQWRWTEQRLAHAKGFSLKIVERVCLQRLGIPNLNPRPQEETAEETTMNKEDEELVERMLQHKRMVSTMETWNGKVTEYRRWYFRRQERASDVPDFATENSKKKKMSSRGMFVCLGGATIEEEEGYGYYGPGGDE